MGQLFSKPQFFGASGLKRTENPQMNSAFHKSLKAKFSGQRSLVISEETAKQIAQALSGWLKEK